MTATGTRCEVLVVGLGVMGSACADALARRGVSVIGVDSEAPVSTVRASSGSSRLWRQFHSQRPELAEPAAAAKALWADLEASLGTTLFTATGGVMISSSKRGDWLRQAEESISAGMPAKLLAGSGLQALLPSVVIEDDDCALYEPQAGVLAAEDCVDGLRRRASAHGARLFFHHRADLTAVELDRSPITVSAGSMTITCDQIIVATGGWNSTHGLPGMPEVRAERTVIHWLDPSHRIPYDASLPFAIFQGDADTATGAVPPIAGRGLKFGRFSTGKIVDPTTMCRDATDSELAADAAALQTRLPWLTSDARVVSHACLHSHTVDERLSVTRLSDNALAVSACEGLGFKFAPLLGELVGNVVEGRPQSDPAWIDLSRG
jgi:sarcosine oxidase